MAGGDEVTVLAPHAAGVRRRWLESGVEAITFRYAPQPLEVLGFGRSLDADEAVRWRAGAVAPLYAWAARRAVRRLAERRDYDLVHAHWIVPNGLIVANCSLAVPMAVGLHGSDVFLAERPGVRAIVARSLRRTRLLTGCSPELVERVCRLGFDPNSARVIPYGVDVEQFAPDRARGAGWRDRLGASANDVLILTVGRMVTKKGFHVLMAALPELLERFPASRFVFAGAGDRLEELRTAAAPWSDRVHFPGAVLRDTLPDLYRAADLFVLPAVHDSEGNVDGLPNVILEAMASGLPVVASNISGIPLVIADGREGFLVAEGDPGSLAEALARLLEAPELRRQMGRQARRKAASDLTWKAIAARYRSAYSLALEPSLGEAAAAGRGPR